MILWWYKYYIQYNVLLYNDYSNIILWCKCISINIQYNNIVCVIIIMSIISIIIIANVSNNNNKYNININS